VTATKQQLPYSFTLGRPQLASSQPIRTDNASRFDALLGPVIDGVAPDLTNTSHFDGNQKKLDGALGRRDKRNLLFRFKSTLAANIPCTKAGISTTNHSLQEAFFFALAQQLNAAVDPQQEICCNRSAADIDTVERQ
jgi:hypothetical protein